MSICLKLLRKKLGVTLETLADKAGLAKSYLSKVERGLNTPSIATALKLTKALNVQVEELFSEGNDGVDGYSIVRRDQRKSLSSGDDGPAYASLAQRIGARALLPLIAHPPHDFSHSALKEHPGEEFIFIHEGRVETNFMSQQIILERGDVLHFDAREPHHIRSLGETQAELLVVIHNDE